MIITPLIEVQARLILALLVLKFYIEGESFKTLVSLDMIKYVNECKSATVRKNVTIPSWLNEMGKSHNLNFSNLLQEAIKKELDIE